MEARLTGEADDVYGSPSACDIGECEACGCVWSDWRFQVVSRVSLLAAGGRGRSLGASPWLRGFVVMVILSQ